MQLKSGAQPSVMSHSFSKVPQVKHQRSTFNRSCGYKTTFDGGDLVPFFNDEVLPGDTFKLSANIFARLGTPIVPVMDNMFIDTFFFFVPNRLIWTNWKKFNGEQDDPGDSTSFTIPQMVSPGGGYLENTLSDYLGIPTKIATLTHSSMFHRAYNLIYNEWFRDENLIDSIVVDKDDGPDTSTDYSIKKRGKRHDYFTACLPFAQKGTAATLPLGTKADVKWNQWAGGTTHEDRFAVATGLTGADGWASGILAEQTDTNLGTGESLNLYADLSTATASTINAIRDVIAVQHLFEMDARGGTRYTEIIRAHFGVTSPDSRLQRPEYLGGGTSMINVNPIAQTSSTDATTPQGNLSALGTASISGHGFTKSFTEHGIILGIVCARADLNYQQGLPRKFSRLTRLDHYWPALAHIGEQSVLNKEIFADASAADELVFGFQERHAEYRYKPSEVTGLFRSNATGTLEIWHLSQDFGALPVLNEAFINEAPDFDRIIATANEPHFLFDAYINLTCARPMPVFGVPGLTRF